MNEGVQCVIGNGVVVHLRGLLAELQTLRDAEIDYTGRIHISDRAHIVFDFHQAIDGYQEKQLAGKKIGTTLKGIGPSYSSKTQRSGLRVGDLKDMVYFEARLRSLVSQLTSAYPGLVIDVDAELAYYQSVRDELLPLITDTIVYCSDALDEGKNILVEGANATSESTFAFQSVCLFLGLPLRSTLSPLSHSVGPGLRHLPVRDLLQPLRGQLLHRPGRAPASHPLCQRHRQGKIKMLVLNEKGSF